MKKTIPITIAGQLFYIEEDAYEQLVTYLHSVKNHFAGLPEHEEIVSDIEGRIAEQFLEGRPAAADKIVTLDQVKKLVEAMGRPQDFDDREEPGPKASQAPEPPRQRKLYRNPQDAVIAGVASGLAAYFGIDPVLMRIIFIALAFLHGVGILAYLIFWLIMPEAKTASEQLQMQGKPVTLESVKEAVKEKKEEVKNSGSLRRIITFPFTVAGTIIRFTINTIFPLLGRIIGAIITAGTIVLLGLLTYAAISVPLNLREPYVDFPWREAISGVTLYAGLAAGYLAIAIPLVFLLLLGITLAARRNKFGTTPSLTLIAIWFVSAVTAAAIATNAAASVRQYIQTNPLYQQATASYSIQNFSKLSVSNSYKVTVMQGSQYAIEASGRQKDLKHLAITVQDGTLLIREKNPLRICIFCDLGTVNVTVTMPAVERLEGSNAAIIRASGITTPSLDIELNNSSRAELEQIAASSTTLHLSNASSATLVGSSTQVSIIASNSSRAYTGNLLAESVSVKASNASRVETSAAKTLSIDASNSSRVMYHGAPQLTTHLSNASRAIPLDVSGTTAPPFAPDQPEYD